MAEVLKKINEEKYIVKASSGPRYVVGVKSKLDKSKLQIGTRVTLDMTTLTIMRVLPREVDPMVFHMLNEDPGKVDFSDIGGLGDQIRMLRETIELPITNPELFRRVGIKPPKGCLIYGPPGTGNYHHFHHYYRQNPTSQSTCLQCQCQVPKSSGFRHRRQVYWRVSQSDQRNVCLC